MLATRLKLIRTELSLSQKDFGNNLGIAQTSYANYENGKTQQLPANVLQVLREKYNINLNWLITGQGSMKLDEQDGEVAPIYNKEEREDTFWVPMTNLKVSAGYGTEWNSGEFNGDLVAVPWHIIRKYCNAKDCAAATVKGDSMSPTLKDGEVVIFCKGLIEDDGIYVISILGELFVKRVSIDRLNKKVRIISDNGKYPLREYDMDREGLEVLGKVIFWIHEE